MAGSNTLTTYYAKRIIGDTAAQNATSALLQTGIGVATDTWILNQTNRIPNPNNSGIYYGIKYAYDLNSTTNNDKLELYGGTSASIWAQLKSGNMYISGKVGINNDPSSNNNDNYYLNIKGSTSPGSGVTAAIAKIHGSIDATATVGTSQLALQNDDGGKVALEFVRGHDTSSKTSWQIINNEDTSPNIEYLCFRNNYSGNNSYGTYAIESLKLFSKGATTNGSGAIPALSIGKSTAPAVALDVSGDGSITGNMTISGTLGVTGATTLSSTLSVTGKVTVSCTNKQENLTGWALQVSGDITANKIFNAIWNDYAEYRECENLMPGICVKENNNGCLTKTDARLIPGASIITDTFGYIQGETDKAKTPIAVCGRVLAYTYRPRENYQAGQAVCSAPNGTVDIMTREEIRDYPDAIVGIVSEIPDYEIWGSGNIKVNNRIWIKIK